MISFRLLAALVCAALLQAPAAWAQSGADVTIFAAASLRGALDELAREYERQGRAKAAVSYDASPVLARRIDEGAAADLFISENAEWMDFLAKRGLIRIETRVNLLTRSKLETVYTAALVTTGRSKLSYEYLRYLRSTAARTVWERHGFEVMP